MKWSPALPMGTALEEGESKSDSHCTLHLIDKLSCCFKEQPVCTNRLKQMISFFCQLSHLLLFPDILKRKHSIVYIHKLLPIDGKLKTVH